MTAPCITPIARTLPATATLLVAAGLSACAGSPTRAPATAPVATAAEQRAATPATLAVERQWLQSWFKGTPVVIAQRNEGTLSIEVPRDFCFDPGRSNVKPALAAVLDKLAESLRRVSITRLTLIAAPEDATAATPLGLERATQVQKQLQSRGVSTSRLAKPSVATAASVQLRMETPPAP
jgi:outer membrane protein OmpA-like peptidoglycan-associated protein